MILSLLLALFISHGIQAARVAKMTKDSDKSRSYLSRMGQKFKPENQDQGKWNFEMDGTTLKQRGSRQDYLGNSHTRFDQYFGGLRVVGRQIVYHEIKGTDAKHVPKKGDWTQNEAARKETKAQRIIACVEKVRKEQNRENRDRKRRSPDRNRGRNRQRVRQDNNRPSPRRNGNRKSTSRDRDNNSKPAVEKVTNRNSQSQVDKLGNCIKGNGRYWKPNDWKPREEKRFTGNFIEGLEDDIGTFNADDFDVKTKLTELKEQAKSDGLTLQDRTDSDVDEVVIFLDPKDNDKAKLAFKVAFVGVNGDGDYSKPEYYIDAKTGEILSKIDSLTKTEYDYYDGDFDEVGTGPGGNEKVGKYVYGSDQDKLLVAIDGDTCSFDTPYVKTIDLGGSNDVYASETAHSFACFEQTGDEENGAYSPLNDAHYYATKTLQMFGEWFGEDHPEIALPLIIKVHLGKWHGFFDGRNVVFGDYKDEAHPAATPDIVAHEICHVVTYYASNLEYSGASGALSEAFSDWGGKALEYYLNGNAVKTWKIGKDIVKEGNDPDALRCLDDPPCDGNSVDHVKDFTEDMEVHYSSGVWNRAFYEMTQKFKYGVWDMFDILYHANINYWQEDETFEGGAEGVLSAAEDLINGASDAGSYWLDTQDIVDGFEVVGIECGKNGEDNWECELDS